MQAIGIVSVVASAIVALGATVIGARTQSRLQLVSVANERLSELLEILDEAAKTLVRAKHVIATKPDRTLWDREIEEIEARLNVRLGSERHLHDEFMGAWHALSHVKEVSESQPSDEEMFEAWVDANDAMERFFDSAARFVGPDLDLVTRRERTSIRERADLFRDWYRWRRYVRRSREQQVRRPRGRGSA